LVIIENLANLAISSHYSVANAALHCCLYRQRSPTSLLVPAPYVSSQVLQSCGNLNGEAASSPAQTQPDSLWSVAASARVPRGHPHGVPAGSQRVSAVPVGKPSYGDAGDELASVRSFDQVDALI